MGITLLAVLLHTGFTLCILLCVIVWCSKQSFPDMGLHFRDLLTTSGLFKITELVLAIGTFIVARVGFDGYNATFGYNLNHTWLGHVTTGMWLVVIPALIICIVLGNPIPWTLDALLSLVGALMYLVSGACAIQYQTDKPSTKGRDISLALGSLCIVTGMIMGMEFFVMKLKHCKKESQTK